MSISRLTIIHAMLLAVMAAACGDDGPTNGTPPAEVISRVTLTFASQSGPTVVRAKFDDPDGDGGEPPTIDPISLAHGTTYDLTISFQNALEDPPEEITDEVRDEGDEHQVFLTGTAVNGPAATNAGAPLQHAYADMDRNGLPLGLANTVMASGGSGQLIVTLQHMPPVNDVAVKTAEAATTARDNGIAMLPGEADVNVTFEVSIPVP